jgi:hypothetical protein
MSTVDPNQISQQALQRYAEDISSEKPTEKGLSKKLVIESITIGEGKEKKEVQFLNYKEISIPQKIQAFFGHGNASFAKVMNFCKDNNLSCAELRGRITTYNKTSRILKHKIIAQNTIDFIESNEKKRITNLKKLFNKLPDPQAITEIKELYPTLQELYLCTREQLDYLTRGLSSDNILYTMCIAAKGPVELFDYVRSTSTMTKSIFEKDINYFKALTAQDAEGNTPLHIACQNVRNFLIPSVFDDVLAQIDANHLHAPTKHMSYFLTMQNNEGQTPLHILCGQKDINDEDEEKIIENCIKNICRHLTDRQKDMTIKDKNGHSPSNLALQQKKLSWSNAVTINLDVELSD